MTRVVAAILLALATGSHAGTPPPPAAPTEPTAPTAPTASAEADFARLAMLVGEWRNAQNPQSTLRIRFALTAGGTVVEESWYRGETLHSLTVYHRDGDRLVLTHYCPQGNQPTLVQTAPAPSLAFTFRSATDLDTASETYLHQLSFDLSTPDRPVRREVYRGADGDEESELILMRV